MAALRIWLRLKRATALRAGGAWARNKCQSSFGLLFDIDGVLVRGRTPIPAAKEAFRKLVDSRGEFQVPVVFVTNAGNCLRQVKAEQLSEVLDVEISQDQVMLSHSPLRMFHDFHNKFVLVSGQGHVEEIARNLGFKRVITIEMLREAFPLLDVVDHNRRPKELPPATKDFTQIEVILFGEPVRWETNLQLIIDVLLTNGSPGDCVRTVPDPHLPILACNMDLMWMAEAQMARFGHGTFLVCLENIYKKITGKDLKYKALIGKPSIITYNYADCLVRKLGESRGLDAPVCRLYAIGDNPMTDIYGANLYNRYIQSAHKLPVPAKVAAGGMLEGQEEVPGIGPVHEGKLAGSAIESCKSILVCTGVYSRHEQLPCDPSVSVTETVFHGHRDFHFDPSLVEPSFEVQDVNEAVDLVFREENRD
ncbi:haloacid dehalogenase-like hydrolase domain-containing 5 isoform X2 [Heptranchias perlo]|uniref:haloacid dehalogenase-like hydrolase domain-containing 5 isoform X2 n=1 Tax=Heptranchias perlo TaxID=212740 RepID=UPI003559885E